MCIGFYNLKEGIIEDQTGEGLKIIAMGDVDNDQHVDLITVNTDLDHFTVHFWDPVLMRYNHTSPVWVDKNHNTSKIASIVISKDKREL